MASSVQEAVLQSVVLIGGTLFAVSMATRLLKFPSFVASLIAPAAVLGAYGAVYQKIPAFPPAGAVNKIFYIAALGAIVGIILDRGSYPRIARAATIIQPVASAVYIGIPLLPHGIINVACAALVGALLQFLLLPAADNNSDYEIDVAGAIAIGILGFAPLALLGASSSSLQLCLTAAAGLGLPLFCQLTSGRYRFGYAGRLGALGGLLSVIWTVVLITAKTDLTAAACLSLVGLAPRIGTMLADKFTLKNAILKHCVVAICALVPAAAAVATAIANYPTTFPM